MKNLVSLALLVLGIILVVVKATGHSTLDWFWTLAPFGVLVAWWLAGIAITLIVALLSALVVIATVIFEKVAARRKARR